MKTNKKILILITLLILNSQVAFSAQQASQTLNMGLGQVLSIEKIIVENTDYNRDEPMPSMRIRESRTPDPDNTFLRLSPMRVQIHTNASTPIIVSAQFRELKHKEGLYNFDPSNLSVEPQSYTISDPYDQIITGIFVPVVDVKPDTVIGRYRGSMFFTLGAI